MARTGRPSKLGSHVTIPATNDEPERTISCAERICELMEAHGMRAELCARDVGVSRKTIESWMALGANAEDKRNQGHLLYPQEQRFLDFLLNTRAAHSRWTHRHLATLASIAEGGLIIGKIVEKVDPTQLDPQGRPLVIERKVEQAKALPDAKALTWLLERQARDDDGVRIFAQRLEVTGADGGPIEVDDRQARIDALNAEADAFLAGADAAAALEGERSEDGAPAAES